MNKIGYLLSIFIVLGCFSGCKKTKLEGEFEIFEGKWRWFQTTNGMDHQFQSGATYDVKRYEDNGEDSYAVFEFKGRKIN